MFLWRRGDYRHRSQAVVGGRHGGYAAGDKIDEGQIPPLQGVPQSLVTAGQKLKIVEGVAEDGMADGPQGFDIDNREGAFFGQDVQTGSVGGQSDRIG